MANQQKVDLSGYARMARNLRKEVGCFSDEVKPKETSKAVKAGVEIYVKRRHKDEIPKSSNVKKQLSKATKTWGESLHPKSNPIKNSSAMYKERD